MRHRIKGKKLRREKAQRKALKKILAANLILNEKIETTVNKAKFVRPLVETLISLSKDRSVDSKRQIKSLIDNKKAEKKLAKELSEKYKERKGGYTKILKLKERKGDNALIVKLELV